VKVLLKLWLLEPFCEGQLCLKLSGIEMLKRELDGLEYETDSK
jgi:hypothetical protein